MNGVHNHEAPMAPEQAERRADMLAESGDGPTFIEVATFVLAVPTSVLGLVGTMALTKKTRLESRKIELDLEEKDGKPVPTPGGQAEGQAAPTTLTGVAPAKHQRRVEHLLVRAVVLYLVLTAWRLAEEILSGVFTGTRIGVGAMLDDATDTVNIIALIAFKTLTALPEVAYWWIFVGLGLPLLLDALKILHI